MALKDMGLVPLIIDVDDDIIKPLFAKEGDYRSRGISLQILNKGKEIDTTGIIVEFFAKPRDGKVYVVEATPVDATKGKYEIVYPSSILQPGVVQCEIRLVKMTDDEIDEIITTKSFNLKVYETIADEDIFEGIDIEPIVEILVQAARNEEERIAAENERIQAENERIQAENARQSNENIRNSNEQTRQQNEAIRQQNEQDRIDLYNALKDLDVSQYELRLQNVENQVNIDNFLLEEWDEPVISLPSNATNGQINEIKISGNTEAEEDNVKSTLGAIRLKSVGKNIWGSKKAADDVVQIINNSNYAYLTNIDGRNCLALVGDGLIRNKDIFNKFKPNTQYTIQVYAKRGHSSYGGGYLQINYTDGSIANVRPPSDVWSKVVYTSVSGKTIESIQLTYSNSGYTNYFDYDTLQLEEGAQATEYEPYKESTLYVLCKDKERNILELRSLPNGTKDEINVAERKLIKRIGEKANVSSGTVINYTDMAEGGMYYAWNDNGETETGTKGDTLGINATVLIYQLAEPIEMPVEVFGNLQSYENGTIYVDTIIPRVDFYTSEGIVLEENEPAIKEIDKLYLVNKENGYLTELDTSKAFIFPDGKGFTHPDLYNDALVDWDYVPDVESTRGSLSMKLPTNLKASVTSTLQGVQELSNKTKKLDTRVIANRRDIYNLQDNFATLQSDVFGISNELDTHISENSRKHISESGENENGRYIKFDDGTMIVYMPDISVIGNDSSYEQIPVPFPHLFNEIPVAFSVPKARVRVSTGERSTIKYFTAIPVNVSGSQISALRFMYGDSSNLGSDYEFIVDVIAIGRWK